LPHFVHNNTLKNLECDHGNYLSVTVLAGGEVFGGEEQVLHGLQDMLFPLVGDVPQEKRWSMAGGDRGGVLMFPARGW
jgi:hypothetical protein